MERCRGHGVAWMKSQSNPNQGREGGLRRPTALSMDMGELRACHDLMRAMPRRREEESRWRLKRSTTPEIAAALGVPEARAAIEADGIEWVVGAALSGSKKSKSLIERHGEKERGRPRGQCGMEEGWAGSLDAPGSRARRPERQGVVKRASSKYLSQAQMGRRQGGHARLKAWRAACVPKISTMVEVLASAPWMRAYAWGEKGGGALHGAEDGPNFFECSKSQSAEGLNLWFRESCLCWSGLCRPGDEN